jgi:hypothetical protein
MGAVRQAAVEGGAQNGPMVARLLAQVDASGVCPAHPMRDAGAEAAARAWRLSWSGAPLPNAAPIYSRDVTSLAGDVFARALTDLTYVARALGVETWRAGQPQGRAGRRAAISSHLVISSLPLARHAHAGRTLWVLPRRSSAPRRLDARPSCRRRRHAIVSSCRLAHVSPIPTNGMCCRWTSPACSLPTRSRPSRAPSTPKTPPYVYVAT